MPQESLYFQSVSMRIAGTVIRGAGQATAAFGFPTLNVEVDNTTLKMESGVYASRATIDTATYDSVTFIGQAHLLPGAPWRVETHCFDQSLPDLTGKQVEIDLLKHVRDAMVFTSEEQALSMIADDVKNARAFFET